MIAANQNNLTIQSLEALPACIKLTHYHVTKNIDRIFGLHPIVPILDNDFVHFFQRLIRSGYRFIFQNIDVVEMKIRSKPNH